MNDVPEALQERLGAEAAAGFVGLLVDVRKEWTDDVLHLVSDRFERRLVEETSTLREATSQLRLEMREGFAATRQEMAAGFSAMRQESADQRFELLKWAFLFWVGQFFAVAGLMSMLIRFRP